MANYNFVTTSDMDIALTYYANLKGITEKELFNIIVAGDLETLVRNYNDVIKDQLFDSYKSASITDQAAIDSIVTKTQIINVPNEKVV